MAVAAITTSDSRRLFPAHRVLGLAAGGLALLHVFALILLPHSLWWTVLLVVMTLWCSKCAWGVWQGAAPQKLLVMSAAMGMLHVVMAVGMPWLGTHHHSATAHASMHGSLMLLMAVGEFVVMFFAALLGHAQHRGSSHC